MPARLKQSSTGSKTCRITHDRPGPRPAISEAGAKPAWPTTARWGVEPRECAAVPVALLYASPNATPPPSPSAPGPGFAHGGCVVRASTCEFARPKHTVETIRRCDALANRLRPPWAANAAHPRSFAPWAPAGEKKSRPGQACGVVRQLRLEAARRSTCWKRKIARRRPPLAFETTAG